MTPFPQEHDDVHGVKILAVLVWTLAVGVVAVGASTLILHSRSAELGEVPMTARPPASASPRTLGTIEQTPIERTSVGLALRGAQERELHKWGWVDRDAGIAKIPIDRAIDLVVEEGGR